MKNISNHLLLVVFFNVFLVSQANAAVYVCTDNNCESHTAITNSQLAIKSRDSSNTTIDQALNNSADKRITNCMTNDEWNLYLKPGLWHLGGTGPKFEEHLTAYVYKDGKHQTTCHVFSYKTKLFGPYKTTCD